MNERAEINDPASAGWHLDKRVPVALLLGLMLNAMAGVWWASSISARVDVLERALLVTQSDHDAIVEMRSTVRSIDDRLERMEQRN